MGNLRQSMTEEEWAELGLNSLAPNGNVIVSSPPSTNNVQHPVHYGGKDNPYEAINIIEAYGMDFCEGNVLKYLLRYKKKNGIEDLKKAQWYLNRLIENEERRNERQGD